MRFPFGLVAETALLPGEVIVNDCCVLGAASLWGTQLAARDGNVSDFGHMGM